MVRQAINARFALSADTGKFLGGSQIGDHARGSNKCVAKIVVVEKTMNVAAEYAAGFIYSAVGKEFCFSLALNVRERMASAFVKSFTDVDFVAFELNLWRGIVAEQAASQGAANAPHDLFRAEHGAHRQKPERRSATGAASIFDTPRVFHGDAEHLKAAADTADGDAACRKPSQLSVKAALFKPRQIVKGLFGAG